MYVYLGLDQRHSRGTEEPQRYHGPNGKADVTPVTFPAAAHHPYGGQYQIILHGACTWRGLAARNRRVATTRNNNTAGGLRDHINVSRRCRIGHAVPAADLPDRLTVPVALSMSGADRCAANSPV